MCGRYANHVGAMHGWTDILSDWPCGVQLGFNIAPTLLIPSFTVNGGEAMRWGLLPSWVQQVNSSYSTFNARLKTVAEKPAFRHAWKTRQRCMIPALGYYEWCNTEGGKQPYFVRRRDGSPIVFAGLYEPAHRSFPSSCTVLTRPSEGALEPLYHAMPVMINPQHAERWMYGDYQDALDVAWRTYEDEYEYYPVSTEVNKVANQGEHLMEPIKSKKQAQQGFDF